MHYEKGMRRIIYIRAYLRCFQIVTERCMACTIGADEFNKNIFAARRPRLRVAAIAID